VNNIDFTSLINIDFPYILQYRLNRMEDPNAELESFREKWKEEVSARAKSAENKDSTSSNERPSKASRRPPAAPRIPNDRVPSSMEDDGRIEPQNLYNLEGPSAAEAGESSKTGSREPRSALEHYEKAVERESQGSLGDSLDLYRKAFKVGMRISSCTHS